MKPEVLAAAGAGLWGPKINGGLDTIDTELGKPRRPFNSPVVGATTTCDLSLARTFVFTVSQATTLAFTNVPSSSFACRIRLLITSGAAFTLTWPASVSWLTGVLPFFKGGAGGPAGTDEVEMLTKDGGTTWFAAVRNIRQPFYYVNGGLSTTSTTDVSLLALTLQAGLLSVNNQQLHIRVTGRYVGANTSQFNIKFGATVVGGKTNGTAGNEFFVYLITITRTGAATQLAVASLVRGNNVSTAEASAPSETLANAIVLDFRGNVITAGTLFYDSISVQHASIA